MHVMYPESEGAVFNYLGSSHIYNETVIPSEWAGPMGKTHRS